ncbi:unnamed protein product [Kuraishia capsulata CBS 1993]|uniref:Uncharacterized protein n=1 Tax=Kuraishia capsulata CBS 1993 TaxID=1382522 RepID=W6MUE0_9ASCO|nr:uncharacterized protein KUCA_T00005164001 [Kuraishia capsulata CBS 1993]CDK29177.1 unnamed protein product [Kuraishia capsulata CBS 1993]
MEERRTSSAARSRSHSTPNGNASQHNSFSLWRYLLVELNVPHILNNGVQSKPVTVEEDSGAIQVNELLNFAKVPIWLEKFMAFGLLYSLNEFLTLLTLTPLRVLIHGLSVMRFQFKMKTTDLSSSGWRYSYLKRDTLWVLLVGASLFTLNSLDTSKIYHNIRAGTAMKLYLMVGVLEVADKLLSALGQDLMKLLFRMRISKTKRKEKSEELCVVIDFYRLLELSGVFGLCIAYLCLHCHIFVYQIMALNVAINSYSNALLTLILSNQFSELKSTVFKKAEREGLFQISCADLTERFQLLVELFIIISRNLFQLYSTGSVGNLFNTGLKPNSWVSQLTFSPSLNNWIGVLMGPTFIVIGSEVLVDWLKHLYITKFNRIQPKIYGKYLTVLSSDYMSSHRLDINGENPDLGSTDVTLTRRTGLPLATVVVVFTKMTVFPWVKSLVLTHDSDGSWEISLQGLFLVVFGFLVVLFLRLTLSLVLLRWANRTVKRSLARSRASGQSSVIQALGDYMPGPPNTSLVELDQDARSQLYDADEKIPPSLEELRRAKLIKRTSGRFDTEDKLDGVMRYEMADKRIW